MKQKERRALKQISRDIGYAKNKRISFLLILVTLALSFVIIISFIIPNKHNLVVGELATQTITSPRDIVDTLTTDELRKQAVDSVLPVYKNDYAVRRETISQINLFFSRLDNARYYAEETYINHINKGLRESKHIDALDKLPSEIDWQEVLNTSDLSTICTLATLDDDKNIALKIASLSQEEIDEINDKLVLILETDMFNTDVLLDEESYKESIKNALNVNYFFSQDLLTLAFIAIDSYVMPYVSMDTKEFAYLATEAELSVESIVYKKGQNLAIKGEVVTKAQFAMLNTLNITNPRAITYKLYISLFMYLAIIYLGFYAYIATFENSFFKTIKNSSMLALILLLAVATISLTQRYQSNICLVLFATIMCSVLVGRRLAISFNLLLSLLLAGVIIWDNGFIMSNAFIKVLILVVSGTAVTLLLKNTAHRSSVLFAGVGAGLFGTGIIIIFGYLQAISSYDVVLSALWFMLSSLLSGIIALGLLPLWEMAFGIATQTKLLELSNIHHKLLQRLLNEAPGTFYHSNMVANLSERAANVLGANGLLVRAAAMYHDIGKLENPYHFIENKSDINPHDRLSAEESAKIIIGHVESSVKIARANNIPSEVVEVISQHHGNALIPNFYYKEKETNARVNEDSFRYTFAKPTTKEAGILMLADSVEAAMRAQKGLSKVQLQDEINALIVEKFNFGLLDDCPLTRKDLGVCAKIFAISLETAQHKRVKYAYNLTGETQG